MSKITNTTKEAHDYPIIPLIEHVFGGPGSIERQEARGQRELVNSTDLPTDGSEGGNAPVWAAFGITFGPPNEGDPMFRPATLPAGWKKEATDHAMHSHLVDDKGRPRAGIFYKAAFYDRSASISPVRRFSVQRMYGADDRDIIQTEVLDAGKRIFATERVPKGPDVTREDWARQREIEDAQQAECVAHLAGLYPKWEDPSAHWDDK